VNGSGSGTPGSDRWNWGGGMSQIRGGKQWVVMRRLVMLCDIYVFRYDVEKGSY
jgi:hypothetical protein